MNTQSYDPDILYFNVRMNSKSDNPFETTAQHDSSSQNTPLVGNPSNYYVAVTDFSCPGESIPISIARIVPNQPDPNKMTSQIALTWNNQIYKTNLIFEPTINTPPPVQYLKYQIITSYYFIYSYELIIRILNKALINVINQAINAFPSFPLDIVEGYPYFYISYNSDFPKINLIMGKNFIQVLNYNTELNGIAAGLSVNYSLINYLGGFDYKFNPNIDPRFLNYIFITPVENDVIPDINNNEYIYLPKTCDKNGNVGFNFIKFEQQNYLLPQWNCLSKIIIYTQSLPIRNQQTTSKTFESPDIVDKYPVLFSFTPNYETASQSRNYLYYAPKENYTLTEMLSTQPLSKIQLSVGWIDHNGEIFPLFLNPFQSCNIQLGFFKKEMYKSIK